MDALLLRTVPKGANDLDRFVYTVMLSRLQKRLECIENDVGFVPIC